MKIGRAGFMGHRAIYSWGAQLICGAGAHPVPYLATGLCKDEEQMISYELFWPVPPRPAGQQTFET